MLCWDFKDKIWSRFVLELLIWPKEVSLKSRTQSSGPLCLWQCFSFLAGAQQHTDWLRGFQRYGLSKSKKRVKMGGCEQTNTLSAKRAKPNSRCTGGVLGGKEGREERVCSKVQFLICRKCNRWADVLFWRESSSNNGDGQMEMVSKENMGNEV